MLTFGQIRILLSIRKSKFETMSFQELKRQTNWTDGNLASKLRQLENENFVKSDRFFIGKHRETNYSITEEGKKHLHLSIMEIKDLLGESILSVQSDEKKISQFQKLTKMVKKKNGEKSARYQDERKQTNNQKKNAISND